MAAATDDDADDVASRKGDDSSDTAQRRATERHGTAQRHGTAEGYRATRHSPGLQSDTAQPRAATALGYCPGLCRRLAPVTSRPARAAAGRAEPLPPSALEAPSGR
ncbi:unnamed protein product [Lampetra planeri]